MRDTCVRGSPGGHRRECFSRNFIPSRGSFMSCMSSMMGVLPLCLVFSLCVITVLGVLLVSSVLCLSLLGGIGLWVCGGLWAFWGSGLCGGLLARLDFAALAGRRRGNVTGDDGSGSRSGPFIS